MDLGPHLGAELLGRQNVALLIQRGTLQPNTALAEGSWARPETYLLMCRIPQGSEVERNVIRTEDHPL